MLQFFWNYAQHSTFVHKQGRLINLKHIFLDIFQLLKLLSEIILEYQKEIQRILWIIQI
jgi:hypothetical protein